MFWSCSRRFPRTSRMPPLAHIDWLIALPVAAGIAATAWRVGALSASGALAAGAVGALSMRAGIAWGGFLILWFALAVLLSRMGRQRKRERMHGIVEKGDRRDARQVLANGGLFAIAAALSLLPTMSDSMLGMLRIGAAASLAAAGADTWATEIGTLSRRPWSLRLWRHVPVGTSGAVTLAGTTAAAAGAFLLAAIAGLIGLVPHAAVLPVAVGGFAGAIVDTIVGAWGQERRWCPACSMATEQHVHDCGAATARQGGLVLMGRSLDNDAVNLLCAVSGAALAVLLWRYLASAPY